MNVAIICPYSFGRPGGVQEHSRGLARALVGLGHDVMLFAPDAKDEHGDGIESISLGSSVGIPGNGSVAPLGIDPRMLVRFDLGLDPADVVHLQEPFLPAALAGLYRTPKSVPVVGTFHAAGTSSLAYSVARPLLRFASRRLRGTIAVSPEARDFVTRFVTVEPEIIPNGVDVESLRTAEPDPWLAGLGRTILFVGRDEPRKGLAVLLEAFEIVRRRLPDVSLVCTAPPEATGGRDGVHALGPVDNVRKLGLFRAATCVCVPSLGGESFGVVVAEAMAAGAPTVASDIPGYRYAGGDAVEYAAPGDTEALAEALMRVLDDAGLQERFRRAAAQRANLFAWPTIAARTVALYDRVLSQ